MLQQYEPCVDDQLRPEYLGVPGLEFDRHLVRLHPQLLLSLQAEELLHDFHGEASI